MLALVGGSGLEPLTSAMSRDFAIQALNSYLDDMLLRGLSVNYVNSVRDFLTRFIGGVEAVSPLSARAYLTQYIQRKPNTRARYLTYIKGFLKYVGMALDLSMKLPKQLPAYVSDNDIETLSEYLRMKHTHKGCGFRDLVIIETACKTGLRRSELANLRVRDIDFSDGQLMVVGGKGAKDRIVPLVTTLQSQLASLCDGKQSEELVFGLSARSLGMKIYTWAKKAGVKLHTHSFRHYFASKLAHRGAHIRAIQELLGHGNLATTEVYISITGKHLTQAIKLLE